MKTRFRISMILLVAVAVWAACGTSYAQTLIGSPGASWQRWSLDDILCGEELNGNNNTFNACIPSSGSVGTPAPYWNTEFGASRPNDELNPAEKNVGFCMTSTGDCQGIGGALFAPGTLEFWALTPFIPGHGRLGTGGARDPIVYFKNSGTSTRSGYRWNSYKATLYLNASAVPCGINAFGWFETNSTGTLPQTDATRHQLFKGTGEPRYTCASTPDSVGTTKTFTPTQYFGFYYSDVSEPACPNGTDPNVQACTPANAPQHGCYAYTLFHQNELRCTDTPPNGNNGAHDLVVFSTNPDSSKATYWIAGEDPTDCTTQDGDCNMTIVKVAAETED